MLRTVARLHRYNRAEPSNAGCRAAVKTCNRRPAACRRVAPPDQSENTCDPARGAEVSRFAHRSTRSYQRASGISRGPAKNEGRRERTDKAFVPPEAFHHDARRYVAAGRANRRRLRDWLLRRICQRNLQLVPHSMRLHYQLSLYLLSGRQAMFPCTADWRLEQVDDFASGHSTIVQRQQTIFRGLDYFLDVNPRQPHFP